jgi:hypothetical protein
MKKQSSLKKATNPLGEQKVNLELNLFEECMLRQLLNIIWDSNNEDPDKYTEVLGKMAHNTVTYNAGRSLHATEVVDTQNYFGRMALASATYGDIAANLVSKLEEAYKASNTARAEALAKMKGQP